MQFINIKYYSIIIFIIILSFFVAYQIKCQDKEYTDIVIIGGGSINANLHSSDFQYIPGYPKLYQNFDKGFGIGAGFFIGSEYIIVNEFLGRDLRLGLNVNYNFYSAKLSKEEKISNYILENSYTDVTVEDMIDTKISALGANVFATIFPLNNYPLAVSAGFGLGIPFQKTFTQKETMLEPSEAVFENNQKNRKEASGDITNFQSTLMFLTFGLRYELFKTNSFVFSPNLEFQYGINNITNDLNWKINSAKAGIHIAYNIPVKQPEPAAAPINPPMPYMPPVPAIATRLELAVKAFTTNHELSNPDSIYYYIFTTSYISKQNIVPKIFYNFNSPKIELTNNTNTNHLQYSALDKIIDYIKVNPDINFTVDYSFLSDEDNSIINKRLDNFKEYLKSLGIDNNRYSINDIKREAKSFRNNELKDDNRYLFFRFSNNLQLISIDSDSLVQYQAADIQFNVKPIIIADATPYEYKAEVLNNNKVLSQIDEKNNTVTINNSNLPDMFTKETKKITIKAQVTDDFKNTKNQEFIVYIKPNYISKEVNYNTKISNDSIIQEFVLGYCEFDKSQFYAVNQTALNIAKQSNNGKYYFEIIPLYDSLGTDEHNIALANSRAKQAMKLLDLNPDNVMVNIPNFFMFPNNIPEGRLLNRAVILRIIKKK